MIRFYYTFIELLPQTVYEGAILIIKDKLRKGTVEIPEIEQVLEDKYPGMKHGKGWEEEEDDYALFASLSNKNGPKKAFKQQLIDPTRKATKTWARN